MSSTKNQHDEKHDSFESLPSSLEGWEMRRTNEEHIFEYWKKGSNHVSGEYEQLAATELSSGKIRILNRVFDQFKNVVRSSRIGQFQPEIGKEQALDYMSRYPSSKELRTLPHMPREIGNWALTKSGIEDNFQVVKWEYDLGIAELTVQETVTERKYSHTRRKFEVTYWELDVGEITIAKDTTRKSAFEIGVNTLTTLKQPVTDHRRELKSLQKIKGIGPSKSKQLLLLGMTSPRVLFDYIPMSSINHHHREAVKKRLTNQVTSDLERRFE